jgi:uncharacterized protein (DUF1697 family)
MAAYDRVALLRAVNVGGRWIAMAELRALFEELGFADAKTLLQSGNVAFRAGRKGDAQLERLLEAETARRFGLRTEYFVRDAKAMHAVLEKNPFPREAARDPGRLHVYFLKEAPERKAVTAFDSAWKGPETMSVVGSHAYVYYPNGAGRSKFKLPWLGTGRNWNTVTKLAAILE